MFEGLGFRVSGLRIQFRIQVFEGLGFRVSGLRI